MLLCSMCDARVWAKILERARTRGQRRPRLCGGGGCGPGSVTCEAALVCYLLFGALNAVAVLAWHWWAQVPVLPSMFVLGIEDRLARIGLCTTGAAAVLLWALFACAPHSVAARWASVIARLSDPRFPALNPPVYAPKR